MHPDQLLTVLRAEATQDVHQIRGRERSRHSQCAALLGSAVAACAQPLEPGSLHGRVEQRTPAGRWGEAEDFAGPVVFLASAASDYMNGSIVTVDGGWMGR